MSFTRNRKRTNGLKTTYFTAMALAVAAGSGAVSAKEFKYTWLEAGYADVDADNNADGDYVYLGGSLDLGNQFFIRGSLGNLDYDSDDADTVSIGVGHPMSISPRSDVVFAADYSMIDADRGPGDVDTLTASAMSRTWLTNNIEGNLSAGLAYQDTDFDNDTGAVIGAGLRLYVTPQFSVAGDIGRSFVGDLDTETVGLSARLEF